MADNFIQLKENDSILTLRIRDEKGNDTGEYLEFNLEDIELPLIYQQIIEEDKKNQIYLKNQFTIIDKKQDHKGKKLMSANEEAKIKALNEFYKKEVELFNMFLGENGVQKLLNGRKISWTSLDYVADIIQEQIKPHIKVNTESIKEKIVKKYGKNSGDVNGEVIE